MFTVNQASIMGESMPVEKRSGDPVFAGSINESGSFEFTVSAPVTDSTLTHIIHIIDRGRPELPGDDVAVERGQAVFTQAAADRVRRAAGTGDY